MWSVVRCGHFVREEEREHLVGDRRVSIVSQESKGRRQVLFEVSTTSSSLLLVVVDKKKRKKER